MLLTKMKYLNPYIAGVGLGLILLAAFAFSGQGLGGSGAIMRSVISGAKLVSQQHVDNNIYMASYGAGIKNPLDSWLVFEVVGVFVGGLLSGIMSGRFKVETNHGPRINRRKRLVLAFLGGSLFGFGARFARGCTSGVALSGGATLAVGSWVTMFAIFFSAYALAYFLRKVWL
jgi:uncharacterized protein